MQKKTSKRSWKRIWRWKDINPIYRESLWSNPDIKRALLYGKNYNKLFWEYIDFVTKGEQSCKLYYSGAPGTGKSLGMLEDGHRIIDVSGGKVHLCQGVQPFCELFECDIIDHKDVAIADDLHEYEGEESIKVWKRVDVLAKSLRQEEYHMLFGSDRLIHALKIRPFAELQTAGICEKRCETLFLIKFEGKYAGTRWIKIRDVEGFKAFMQPGKTDFMGIVKHTGGKMLVTKSVLAPEVVEPVRFDFTPANIKEFLVTNCDDNPSKISIILQRIFEVPPKVQHDIAKELGISQNAISLKLRKFAQSSKPKGMGNLIEVFARKMFNDDRKFLSRAPQDKPDVIPPNGYIQSVKSSINLYENSHKINPIKDCDPELNEALKRGHDKVVLLFTNPLWKDGFIPFEMNPKNPPSWITFFKEGKIKWATDEGIREGTWQ